MFASYLNGWVENYWYISLHENPTANMVVVFLIVSNYIETSLLFSNWNAEKSKLPSGIMCGIRQKESRRWLAAVKFRVSSRS